MSKHDDELGRAIDRRPRRRKRAKRNERRQCGDELLRGQVQPPTETDSDAMQSISDREVELIARDTFCSRHRVKNRAVVTRKARSASPRAHTGGRPCWLTMPLQSHTSIRAVVHLPACAISRVLARCRERGEMQKRRPSCWSCLMAGVGAKRPPTTPSVQARTPSFDHLWATCPHALLRTSGKDVGLPEGQMGNSEVGHLNIGAGRLVMQDLPRLTRRLPTATSKERPHSTA